MCSCLNPKESPCSSCHTIRFVAPSGEFASRNLTGRLSWHQDCHGPGKHLDGTSKSIRGAEGQSQASLMVKWEVELVLQRKL